ncbi:MAG: hypothetical protein WAT58_03275 [Candidatus Dormiibacterota bacterium]
MPRRRPRPWQPDRPGRGRPAPRASGGGGSRSRRLDLHGYDVATAVDIALRVVREAYDNGYLEVEVLHGARDVVDPVHPGEGRGGIKWELRRMLDRGQFDAWVSGADALEGSIRFRLRNNPRQRPERWSDVPPPTRG